MSTSSSRTGEAALVEFSSRSESETIALGRRLGERLAPGQVIGLVGPLGAGKTRFVRGLALGLGVDDVDSVRSPTYVLHHVYGARGRRLHHVDAYRLSGPAEYEALDVGGSMAPGDCLVVEWADRIATALPKETVWIEFSIPPNSPEDSLVRSVRTRAGGAAQAAWAAE